MLSITNRLLLNVKGLARKFGIDVRAWHPSRSDAARYMTIFNHCGIDLVLDVGANEGQYAKYLRAIGYGGRIVSFEPLSSAHARVKNLARDDKLWEIAPRMALGEYDGEVEINIAANSESSSILPMLQAHVAAAPSSHYIGKEKVPVQRLDTVLGQYFQEPQNLFLKVDAQGYERNVLRGAEQVLSSIKGIQLELSLVQLYEGELLFKEMIDLLEMAGYTLYDLTPNFADNITGRVYQMDGVFIRE